MKILGIGEAVVDHISVIEHSSLTDSPRVIESCHDAGGPVLSALILLARLGGNCTFVTSLGNDAQGAFIRKTLTAEGVALQVNQQRKTKMHTVVVDSLTGERTKLRGGVEHQPIARLKPDFIKSFDMIIMDRHEHGAFAEIVKHKRHDTLLITDPSTEVSAFTMDMIRESTCPIIPIEALAELAQGQTLGEALDTLNAICHKPFVVTLGDMGSLIHDNHTAVHVAPISVEAVDTTGAGDVYRGAFAFGLTQQWSLEDCAAFGNTAAGLQCTRHGNAAAVTTADELRTVHGKSSRRDVSLSAIEARFADMSGADTTSFTSFASEAMALG